MDFDRAPNPRVQRRIVRLALLSGLLTLIFGFWGHWAAGTPILERFSLVLYDLAGLLILDAPEIAVDTEAYEGGGYNWPFSVARVFGVLTTALGIAFIGVGLYREGADRVKLRRIAWKARKGRPGHIVVCGLGRAGRQLLSDLSSERFTEDVVVIEKDPTNPWAETYRELGAVVLIGDAGDSVVRARARLDVAKAVLVACGDDAVNLDIAGGIARDLRDQGGPADQHGTVPQRGRVHRKRVRRGPVRCYTHVAGPRLQHAFHERDLFAEHAEVVDFRTFNMPENAARALLRDDGGLARPPHAPSADDEVAHYVIFGFGTSGQNVALQTARLAHFLNRKRLRLTIVDDFSEDLATDPVVRSFLDRYPAFCPDPACFSLADHVRSTDPEKDDWGFRGANGENRPVHPSWRSEDARAVEYVVNAEFVRMPGEVDAPDLVDALVERLGRDPVHRVLPGAVVCFDEDRLNFEAALRFAAALEREHVRMPIYVYLPEEEGLAALLEPAGPGQDRRRLVDSTHHVRGTAKPSAVRDLHPFGMRGQSASYRQVVRPVIQEMAEALHEAYEDHAEAERAQARREVERAGADGKSFAEILAPYERTPFSRLHPRYRVSNEEAAAHAVIKLDAIGCIARPAGEVPPGASVVEMLSRSEVERLAEVEHNRWVAERLLGGWRFGVEDDAQRKRRRTLCTWSHLTDTDLIDSHPEEHREKDRVTVRQLVGAFRRARLAVYRARSGSAVESASGGTMR